METPMETPIADQSTTKNLANSANNNAGDSGLVPSSAKREYWMSLEHFNGDAAFAEKAETEFQSSPLREGDAEDGFARREFLKLMGASVALATTACIRRPVQKIIPYAQAPKEITPGVPNFYASTWYDGIEGYGTLVKTFEGRPIKIEGNPSHPMNLGGLTARPHAEVLSLYDPDRLAGPVRNLPNKTRTNKETISTKWEEADAAVLTELEKGDVAILSSTLPSPSTRAMIADFTKSFGSVRWVQYDTLAADDILEASRLSYGKAVVPRYRFDKAKIIVSIGADFLGTHLSPAEFMKQWARVRKPGANMARLVMFESMMSITGMNADDRIRIKPSEYLSVVYLLIAKLQKKGMSIPASAAAIAKLGEEQASKLNAKESMIDALATELWENKGRGLVVAGGLTTQTADALQLQIAVNFLNSALGNDGVTVDHDAAAFETRKGSAKELSALISDLSAGKVKTLIVHNLNPAYALPEDAEFAASLSKVPFVIYTGNRNDETGKYANLVLPSGSTLESWGDYELQSGLFSIQQPTIRPLHDSRSFEESLFAWSQKSKSPAARVKSAKDWYEYVVQTWKSEIYPRSIDAKGKSFDEFWMTVLQKGIAETHDRRDRTSAPRSFNAAALGAVNKKSSSEFELVIYSTAHIADGRYANVAWLQELPDPVTKVVWDNFASVSIATARRTGLKDGDMIDLQAGAKTLTVPVHVQPGMADDVFALAIGYGRSNPGKVAKEIGADAYKLASFNSGAPIYAGIAVKFTKAAGHYKLASTQTHHIIGDDIKERQIVVETTNEAFQKKPSSGIHNHKVFSIWPSHQYNKHKWAMSIDLNVCTGCSACVMACQSENNIPVVGKKYVMQGREMHWIRIDRYYKGQPENPDVALMPLTCQQCETAPCETVCPVAATTHSEEGLNDMAYNRCVGTRYCSNNCPYKVRRFNWFNYSKREEPLHMALNPDVTVRVRGVMEKCTFCVHRIRASVGSAKANKEPGQLVDGSLQTACQQTCPTNAITFGDLNDKASAVAKLFGEARSYALLEDLNTQPRVRYMSRIRNADRPELAHEEGGEHE